jgi:hypothetical protein
MAGNSAEWGVRSAESPWSHRAQSRIPTGFCPKAQGWRNAPTLGDGSKIFCNPESGCVCFPYHGRSSLDSVCIASFALINVATSLSDLFSISRATQRSRSVVAATLDSLALIRKCSRERCTFFSSCFRMFTLFTIRVGFLVGGVKGLKLCE